jgi:hypothetical protein
MGETKMTNKDKLQEAFELEEKAKRLRIEASQEKYKAENNKKREFEETQKIDVYTSDDYCGLTLPNISFYYGYEETQCPVKSHRKNCEDNGCEKREWCFVVTIKGKKVMKIPTSKLHPTEGEEPFWYLVAGMGHYLKKYGK